MRGQSLVVPSGTTVDSPTFTGTVSGNVISAVRAAIPFLRSPSGTMGNNGAFTSGTAFGKTYPKCYIYFAANQIAAGVAAGWYYATGSSTTAFTIFNNTYTSGAPTIPASPTAFVTTGPGATTGDTTEQGILFNLSAGRLGTMGGFREAARFTNNNSAGTKTYRVRYSGVGGTALAAASNTTQVAMELNCATFNQAATNAQESTAFQFNGASVTGQYITSAIDTTAATTIAVTSQIGTATDWAVIEWALQETMTDGT